MRWTGIYWAALLPLTLVEVGCKREGESREAREAGRPAAETTAAPAAAARAPAPVAEAEDTVRALHAPDAELQKARDMLASDARGAAAQLRAAGSVVRDEAATAAGDARTRLDQSARSLDELADRVAAGRVRSARELDRESARVHQALAEAHYRRAREEWARQDARRAGEDLRAASSHLEHALKYAGRESDRGAHTVVRDSRDLAGKLASGAGSAKEEVERGFRAFGNELEKLGREVEPGRSAGGGDTGRARVDSNRTPG